VRVLLDANALMMPFQFQVDLFTELASLIGAYEPCILSEVRDELRGLSRGRGSGGSAARAALRLAEQCREVESGYEEGSVDERINRFARDHGCMVVTSDRTLRNALLSAGVPVITLKQQKRLELLRR
jgi:hypothetical protein